MRTILYLVTLLFLSLNFYSQETSKKIDTTKTYVVEYDFKTGKYVKALVKPKVDRPIIYKIKNINRLAFDVQVNSKDVVVAETDWFTSAEDLKKISGLISQDSPTSQAKVEEAVKNTEIKINKTEVQPKEVQSEIGVIQKLDKLNAESQQKQKVLDVLKNNKIKYEYYKSIFGDSATYRGIEKPKDSEIAAKQNEIDTLKTNINKLENLKNEKLDKFQNAKNLFNVAYDEFIKSYNKVNTIIQTSNKVLPIAKLPFLNKKDYESSYQKSFQDLFIDLNVSTITSNTINSQYTDLVVAYNKLKDVNGLITYFDETSLKKYFNDIDLLMDNAKKIKFKEELIDFEKLSQQVQRIIHLLEKDETYEYISAPIQPRNDMATFDVVIKAKNKEIEVDNSRSFTHSVSVKGGTRIDFSIGLAASYFGNANVYEIYTIDGKNLIGLKSKNLTVPSLVTMISLTNRATRYGAIGGSAGLGIDTNNGKIQLSNFFIGPTLILGKYDRMMITSGAAIRNVGQLKNGYVVDETIITQSSDVSSVLSDNYKVGFFVALTYNLTNNVRNKISNYKP